MLPWTHLWMPEDEPCRRYARLVPAHGKIRPERHVLCSEAAGDTENTSRHDCLISYKPI